MTPSAHRIASIAAAVCLAALAATLYLRKLDAPAPAGVEIELTSEAHAVAASGGRDGEGRLYPVFWHGSGDRWLAPMPVYAGALAVGLFDSDSGFRIATAGIGTLGVLLFYRLVHRTFKSIGLALVAGVLLLLTPAYVTFSRTATHDGIWPVPLTVAWLLGLATALGQTREQSRGIVICAAALTASIYSQPSGALTMVLLTALTAGALWPTRRWTPRTLAMAAAAAALVALPLALWLARYPATYANTLGRWLLHPAHVRNPLEWARALTNWNTLSAVSKTYWDFFSPSHLLLSDTAPALAGVYVLPAGLLIVVGAREVLRNRGNDAASSALARVALLGFVGLPLVAAAFGGPQAIDRAVPIVPMGILLAANGIHVLWYASSRCRALVVLAVAAAVAQSLARYIGFVSGVQR